MGNQVGPIDRACKSYEEDLVLYYYAETGATERAAIEQHLAQCLRCRKFVDDLGRLLPQMAPKPELPPAFWDNYFRETVVKLDEDSFFDALVADRWHCVQLASIATCLAIQGSKSHHLYYNSL